METVTLSCSESLSVERLMFERLVLLLDSIEAVFPVTSPCPLL